ncbi:MAG: AAA family ATPase [Candidatus Eremiobacterota bacterium]
MLLNSQLAQLQVILGDAGVDFSKLGWVRKEEVRLLDGIHLRGNPTVYREPVTGYFFVFGEDVKGRRRGCYAPGEFHVLENYEVDGWEALLPHVSAWAGWLRRELDVVVRWFEGHHPERARQVLLGSQMEQVYLTLLQRGVGPPSIFEWQGSTSEAKLLVRAPDRQYWFRWERPLGKWTISYSPAKETQQFHATEVPWAAVQTHIENWATYLARELRVEFTGQTVAADWIPGAFRVSWLRLEGVRRFLNLEVTFPSDLTVLVGKNATGKTSILRCLALALCHRQDAEALLASPIGRFVGDNLERAEIRVELRGPQTIHMRTVLRVSNGREEIAEHTATDDQGNEVERPRLLVCGYGCGRAVEGRDLGRGDYRTATSLGPLFQYETHLLSTELTLRRLDSLRREPPSGGGEAFRKLYADWTESIGTRVGLPDARLELVPGGGVEIHEPGRAPLPFAGWADGYRLTVAWMLDVLGWALLAHSMDLVSGQPCGLLLLDEVEQHLHPSMQASLISRLKEAFPSMQIVATTHSPLVALGGKPEELVVLTPAPDGSVIRTSPPDFTTFSVEDMYTDEGLFATEPYSPETQEKFRRYWELREINRDPEQDLELRQLAQELQPLPRT